MANRTRTPVGLPPIPMSLRYIAELDESKLYAIQSAISGPSGFALSAEQIENLASQLEEEDLSKIGGVLESIAFLYNRSRDWPTESRDTEEIVSDFLKTTDLWRFLGDNAENNIKKLAIVLGENIAANRKRKLQWLQSGILPTVTSFSSFVDFRPSFNKDRTDIDEFVSVIIYSIQIEDPTGEEKVLSFQMSKDDFEFMKKSIEDVDKKISFINKNHDSFLNRKFES